MIPDHPEIISHRMSQIFTEEKPVQQKHFMRNAFCVILSTLRRNASEDG
jgi:hypothetical protein